jgi:predicted molibdopterin-dependent oxidoreductase YjgC
VTIISQFIRTNQIKINLDELFSQLIDESRRLKSKEDKEMALNSKASSGEAKSKKDKPRKTKRTCSYCGKSGYNKN